MAPSSKSPSSYLDVHRAFEQAGMLGTVTLVFSCAQDAAVWNARANKYRVLLRQRNDKLGEDHVSPFDHLIIRAPKEARHTRVISHRGYNFQTLGPDGKEIELERTSISGPVDVSILAENRKPSADTVRPSDLAFLDEFEASLASDEDDE